ncbi:MAG: PDZ domain-containing protein [Actinomycetota bacterium]|nr:PDZ domain-containing protein [Actinomycetota bacterium]
MVAPGPPPSPGGAAPAGLRRRRWPAVLVVVLLLLLIATFLPIPYYAVAPGSARQVNDLIRTPAERSVPPRGRVLMATVSLRKLTPVDALVGWLDGETEVVAEEEILGSTSREEFSRQNRELMEESKQAATVVALRQLGYAVPEHGTGALVVDVEKGSPADGRLAPDEVVIAVDGRPTPLASQAVSTIRARKPGETVRLDVRGRQGATRREQVVLTRNPKREGGFLGVFVVTKDQRFDFPFDVRIESGDIGGPSAGLAYTLGILDSLTVGELTAGKKVAATGTMEMDGTVGEVGGVAQKTAAVRSSGVDYFLVPPGEYDEAKAHAGDDLEVVKVSSVSEAVAALAGLGGEARALAGPAAKKSFEVRRRRP